MDQAHGIEPGESGNGCRRHVGIITILKSIRKERIGQNRDMYDFALTPEEVAAISKLNKNRRNGDDPDNFNF